MFTRGRVGGLGRRDAGIEQVGARTFPNVPIPAAARRRREDDGRTDHRPPLRTRDGDVPVFNDLAIVIVDRAQNDFVVQETCEGDEDVANALVREKGSKVEPILDAGARVRQ